MIILLQVPLREGHTLLISKSLKVKLVLKSKTSLKNPVRLLKRLLEYLYGKAQLKLMSAKGLRSFIGIPDSDLLAIYGKYILVEKVSEIFYKFCPNICFICSISQQVCSRGHRL